ncbi:unnamed protein product [Spirodela intermedia]|uniref:Uncharacterized protein n=2 Tax=Spirodela intermedia TaxID=51605 RepID=A0A7I8K5Z1_SPIIN|nr:unnamed protein product [Spirodela intermedia]CAA6656413.1 unnamed protein product [Spirodela intermedia]CAA7391979.1 unnamed protein product [Spirodela intermedia]
MVNINLMLIIHYKFWVFDHTHYLLQWHFYLIIEIKY